MGWVGHVPYIGEMRNVHKILVRKPEKKRPCRWNDNMKMYLREIGWEGVDWIHLAQDTDQWQTCKHDNEPLGSTKVREFLD
jgi:hypothetical protein